MYNNLVVYDLIMYLSKIGYYYGIPRKQVAMSYVWLSLSDPWKCCNLSHAI